MNNSLSNEFRNYFRFFEGFAELFEARFLSPLCKEYPNCESDTLEALLLFLDGYAFTRQGARPDYSHVAVGVVRKLIEEQGYKLMDGRTPQEAWKRFGEELDNQGLNPKNNPLSNKENKPSILEFIQRNEKFQRTSIVALANESIKEDKVEDYHNELRTINGIGPKIASLFLRDVALFYKTFPTKDRDLLQPIDVWVRRISHYFWGDKLSDQEIAKRIAGQAIQSGVIPEAVNEGMWYFGSQIAGSEYRMKKALNDLAYAKSLIEKHMESICQEAIVWEQKNEAFYG